MGIKFKCEHCHRTLNVKADLGGKRGICPKCQGKIEIPLASTEADGDGLPDATPPDAAASVSVRTAPADGPSGSAFDPIAEAPQLNWYVAPAGSMTKYGPAPGDLMRSWIREGRVSGDSLVWREGWPQWRVAVQAFPELVRLSANSVSPTPRPDPIAAALPDTASMESDDVDAFDGSIRAPRGVDIGVDDLDDPLPPVGAASFVAEAAPQDSFAAVLAPFDDEPETRRTPSRTATSLSGRSQISANAFLISGLLITFIALVALLIYLLTRGS
jgi:hypothetical protein